MKSSILIVLMAVFLVVTVSQMSEAVDPKVCYMWDKCRRLYQSQGNQVVIWECANVQMCQLDASFLVNRLILIPLFDNHLTIFN